MQITGEETSAAAKTTRGSPGPRDYTNHALGRSTVSLRGFTFQRSGIDPEPVINS